MNVPLCRPELGAEERAFVHQVLVSGHLVQGGWVARFEGELSGLLGGRSIIATSSGTTALYLALLRHGIGPGDEVIVPALTFPAPANVAELLGACVVPVDVDPETCGVTPKAVAAAITSKTKAVVVVHQYGIPVDVGALRAAVKQITPAWESILWVEDAACALGAFTSDGPCGTLGDVGCYSFHPRKIVTTGEGGAVVVDDYAEAVWYRQMRNHGQDVAAVEFADRFPMPGHNFRMSDVHAAIGVGQLPCLNNLIARRDYLARRYSELLETIPDVRIPQGLFGRGSVVQSFVVRLPAHVSRARIIQRLATVGVETTTAGYSIPRLAYFAKKYDFGADVCPEAARFHDHGLTIPLYPSMNDSAQHYVAEQLRSAIASEFVS